MLSYEQARKKVIEQVGKKKGPRAIASVSVWDALGLVLAQDVKTDREYPPFDRSTRDGYAVRSNEVSPGAQRKCAGEIKAGDVVRESLAEGTCWQIMTGAAVPSGADAVVMIEHSSREGDFVRFERAAQRGQNIVSKGSEAAAAQTILKAGMRLGFAELALAAQVGAAQLQCAQQPRVAILSTGDEVVLIDETPGPFQIRNSNSVSLAAQVRIAGGEPVVLGNAADRIEDLEEKIERGLKEDRKSTRLNSSHRTISYAVFCLKKKKILILGGDNPATKTTEIIDLGQITPRWVQGPPMSQARVEMEATLLPNGKVFVSGCSAED